MLNKGTCNLLRVGIIAKLSVNIPVHFLAHLATVPCCLTLLAFHWRGRDSAERASGTISQAHCHSSFVEISLLVTTQPNHLIGKIEIFFVSWIVRIWVERK